MRWTWRTNTWSPPLEGPWRETRFTAIDVEATGLDLRRDEIVSIGAVDVVGGLVDSATSWYQPLRPDRAIEPEALKVHSLTYDELSSAPPIDDVIEVLHDRISDSVLVAHAAWVERAFLDRALAPLRRRVPSWMVDTAALARAAGLAPPLTETDGREPDLELLARKLDLPVFHPHHALGDAFTTAVVLIVLATRFEATHDGLQVEDLVVLSRRHGR